jgi:hypothetical protein
MEFKFIEQYIVVIVYVYGKCSPLTVKSFFLSLDLMQH